MNRMATGGTVCGDSGEQSVAEGISSPAWMLRAYRPRGSLARALYEKQFNDNYLNNLDKSEVRHTFGSMCFLYVSTPKTEFIHTHCLNSFRCRYL